MQHSSWRRLAGPGLALTMVMALLVSLLALGPATSRAQSGTGVFINEFHYDNDGTDTGEAIELRAEAGADLTGWSIVLYNGNGGASYSTENLAGVVVDSGDGFGYVVVNYPSNGIQNGSPDGIALVDAEGNVVEFLSYEGSFTAVGGPADGLISTDIGVSEPGDTAIGDSLQLIDGAWIGPISSTFGAANVQNGGPGEPQTVKIHEIQGSGAVSPLDGQTVIVEAVVVGDFQDGSAGTNGDLNGFYIQEEDADADTNPATSEGLFVFDGSSPAVDVNIGDLVRVTGVVDEFFDLTQLTSVSALEIVGTADLPTPVSISLPVNAIDDFEAYEGMAAMFPQELVISEYFNYDRFGEMVLALPLNGEDRPYNPTAVELPGPDAEARKEANALSRITLDDGLSSQNPAVLRHPNGESFAQDNFFRGGDKVKNTVGILTYAFDLYRIQPTGPAEYIVVNSRPEEPADVGGRLKVASFNVLNYFLTIDDGVNDICGANQNLECRGADNAEEFDRQETKIVEALLAIDADVVGLIEMENTPGVEPLARLVEQLNAQAGAGTYAFIDTGVIGTDAIRVGFIYKPASVSPEGDFAILDASVDPRFIDTRNRPALAQTFTENATGARFTAVVNHFKSKGSGCGAGDDDLLQGNCNGTRTLAAQALADWLAGDPTGSGDADFMIIGDLNAYAREDPIIALEGAGYIDLIAQFFAGSTAFPYSFVFSGEFGYLDYALANGPLASQVSGVTEWHINADEADAFDYDTSFKPDPIDALYEPTAFRSSDHDPVIVGLNLQAPVAALTIVKEANPAAPWLDWEFTGSGDIGSFTLDNDDTSATPDRLTFELAPGSYTVSETNRPGNWDLRIACDAEFSAEGDSVTVALAAGSEVTCTFSNERRPQIRITKYEDLNENGQRDQGEPGLKDWQMFLYISDGQGGWQQIQPREVRTRGNGTANYTNLEPGIDHLVCEEQRAGWRSSEPASPLEVDGRICQVVQNLSYGEVRDVQFGNFQETMLYRAIQVGARVWIERNVVLAGLNDFDRDGDGWALVGRTNGAGNNGELRGFFMEGEFPYAVIFNYSRNKGDRCILVTPSNLDQVRKGQTRMVTTVQDPYINPEFGCEAP